MPEAERPSVWRKSSFSANGDCLELMSDAGGVWLRDSKDQSGVVLRLSRSQWATVVLAIKAGKANF